jgi:hypothetical protein
MHVKLWDYERFKHHDIIGFADIDLKKYDI